MQMTVPKLQKAGTYYLWPGLQDTANTGVYQSVLDGRSGTWWIGSGWCCRYVLVFMSLFFYILGVRGLEPGWDGIGMLRRVGYCSNPNLPWGDGFNVRFLTSPLHISFGN